jgi:hypothetical protein
MGAIKKCYSSKVLKFDTVAVSYHLNVHNKISDLINKSNRRRNSFRILMELCIGNLCLKYTASSSCCHQAPMPFLLSKDKTHHAQTFSMSGFAFLIILRALLDLLFMDYPNYARKSSKFTITASIR